MTEELTRIDSAVAGLSISSKDEKAQTKTKTVEKEKKHKRVSSTAEGVRNIKDLGQSSVMDLSTTASNRFVSCREGSNSD